MTKALLYGLATALPLVIGAAIGLRWKIPRPALAALMAFGAGTMIAAASAELFEPAFDEVAAWHAGLALLLGAGTYVVANHLLDRMVGAAAVGWGLMLGTLLDGIPENTALGVTLGRAAASCCSSPSPSATPPRRSAAPPRCVRPAAATASG